MKTQFITDSKGNKTAVILPIKEYQKILEELEEAQCIKAYDKIKAGKPEFLPAEDVFKAVEGK
jgi:hypothetical protein